MKVMDRLGNQLKPGDTVYFGPLEAISTSRNRARFRKPPAALAWASRSRLLRIRTKPMSCSGT